MRNRETTLLADAVRLPTRREAALFRVKVTLLRIGRWAADSAVTRPPLHRQGFPGAFPCLLAESRTPLWTSDKLSERQLQEGKAQNLRAAIRHLNGATIASGTLFSFWRQIGRATRARGFVEGRELREGCIIPAIGGGLCQLSNALYDLALRTGAEIVERHPHTRIIPGSTAAKGRDATVAWNYIDLRFRVSRATRIVAFLTSDELVLQFYASEPIAVLTPFQPIKRRISLLDPSVQSCENCGETACFRHTEPRLISEAKTAFLAENVWPEYKEYVRGGTLPIPSATAVLRNRISARLAQRGGPAAVRAEHFAASERLARRFAARLTPENTHLVVAQNVLPFLWREGHLGGRTFDVLMQRLPLGTLHARLDAAFAQFPDRGLLGDFRAPEALVALERDALAAAQKIITPHAEIATQFESQAVPLLWQIPGGSTKSVPLRVPDMPVILFPGPTVSRKGAWEVRAAARHLGAAVLLLRNELEGGDFWDGVVTRRILPGESWWENAAFVVQPSLVEDAPRILLRAIAAGLPVITTKGSGLSEAPGVHFVAFGDVEAITEVVSGYYATI